VDASRNTSDLIQDRKDATRLLCTKVRLIARRGVGLKRPVMRSVETRRLPENAPKPAFFRSSGLLSGRKDAAKQPTVSSVRPSGKHYKCLAIGASTGGPVALQKVLSPLPADFPYPIVLVQHMPGTFTSAFAQRLDSNCKISVKEAETGDVLKPGHAYLAPGGKQMIIESAGVNKTITIVEASAADKVSYKPSVDLTFSSIARAYGGDVLGVILTGMGADGREGCRTLKGLGATIWAQDQDSCVVYGMPQAVAVENISSKSINIDDISSCIQSEMR